VIIGAVLMAGAGLVYLTGMHNKHPYHQTTNCNDGCEALEDLLSTIRAAPAVTTTAMLVLRINSYDPDCCDYNYNSQHGMPSHHYWRTMTEAAQGVIST